MKKLFYVFLIIQCSYVNAQWENNIRLTNDPAISETCLNNGYSAAASGDTIHVVWADQRTGGYKIYYKRSFNGGLTWSPDTALSGGIASPKAPVIALNGAKVHIAFYSYVNQDQSHIWYKMSTNSGVDWNSAVEIHEAIYPQFAKNPSIAATGSYVHISWLLEFGGSSLSCIDYKRSTDQGENWGTLNQLTVGNDKDIPSICASGNNVLIVYSDNQYGEREITCSRSTNAGLYWSSSRLTDAPKTSHQPSITISGEHAIVVWVDYRNDDARLFQKRTTNAGETWMAEGQLTTNAYIPYRPNIILSGSNAHIVWYDSVGNQIYYLKGLNYGSQWQTRTKITDSPCLPYNISVTASGSKVHVVWADKQHGEGEVYYKRNPTGNTIGIKKTGTEVPVSFELYQNYPNPFNPVTKIRFNIPSNVKSETSNVRVVIFDVLGKEVATLVNEQLTPGTYEVEWPACRSCGEGRDGSNYASGIYYYKLISNNFTETKKMVLIK